MAANRERRAGAGQRVYGAAANAVEQLKAIRAGGLTRANQLQLQDAGDVYDEMDEDQYQQYVKQRKEEDSNWVDDDVGLMDGDDEWDENGQKKQTQSISRVNMAARGGGRSGVAMPVDDRISSMFLGLKQQERRNLVSRQTRLACSACCRASLLSSAAHSLVRLCVFVLSVEWSEWCQIDRGSR